MKKLDTYEQYSEVLSTFKKDKERCSTNKLFTRDELTALIEAEKLYYDEIGGVLWFFVNEGYFYTANFFVPANVPIQMRKQDMDVVVELTGNGTRYNEQWERELIVAGYEKGDKRLERVCQLEDVVGFVQESIKTWRRACGKQGLTHRKAVKADYPEIRRLLEDRIGKHRYTIVAMTDAELDEMERFGRCNVICGPDGGIRAVNIYLKRNKTSYDYVAAAYDPGLGPWASAEGLVSAYQEGCVKTVAWMREDNPAAIKMCKYTHRLTGKFYWQFICKAGAGNAMR